MAVISRESRPLYLRAFVPEKQTKEQGKGHQNSVDNGALEEELRCNMLAHMSLDVFDSGVVPATTGKTATLLFVQDGTRVYGRATNAGVKVVIGVGATATATVTLEGYVEGDARLVEHVSDIMDGIQRAYVRAVTGAFTTIGGGSGRSSDAAVERALRSGSVFDQSVGKLVSGDI